MSRVVGEHPWTEVYESQDADSSWSTEGTAFRGFYVPGNSLYFCFFFSFCQAIFLHHLEILLLTFTFKSRPVSHFSQPSLPCSLLPALSSGLGAGQLTQSKRPRLCCGFPSSHNRPDLLSLHRPALSADSLSAVFLAGPVHAALCLLGPLTSPQRAAWTSPQSLLRAHHLIAELSFTVSFPGGSSVHSIAVAFLCTIALCSVSPLGFPEALAMSRSS